MADFYCANCREDFELKSKNGAIGAKIVDGAYKTMLERLGSATNPNFFLLNYDRLNLEVTNFLVIPKHFFVPEIIQKRQPLAPTARRAGWIGCNIILQSIPTSGRIFIVKNRQIQLKSEVLSIWQKTVFLREEKQISAKGWLLDTMRIIDKISKNEFVLADVYKYENELSKLHPDNRHIKDKIRQQLQILRDYRYLEFTGRGAYKLI